MSVRPAPRNEEAITRARGALALSSLIVNNRRAVPLLFPYTVGLFYALVGEPIYRDGQAYYRVRPIRIGTEGIPDDVGVLDGGRALFLEWKSSTGKLREMQIARREAIVASGALYVMPRTVETAVEAVMGAVGK